MSVETNKQIEIHVSADFASEFNRCFYSFELSNMCVLQQKDDEIKSFLYMIIKLFTRHYAIYCFVLKK